MKLNSKIVHIGVRSDEKTGAISTPIYQTASFAHPAVGQSTGYDYTRTKNPTREVLEKGIAILENGAGGYAFATGMAAITAVLMLYKAGDHIVVIQDCYGGTYRVIDKVFAPFGLTATYVDATDVENIAAAIQANTKAVLIETPTNPLMSIVDIAATARLTKSKGIHLIVDNTFLTPCLQRPLELGADIVLHSGTKYLAGHNDLLCGLVVAKDPELAEKIQYIQNATGNILSPGDSWLLIRGMKTLALRMQRHNENAQAVAEWLNQHRHVTKVYYPGLAEHPGKAVQDKQASGYGGMVSFTVKRPELVLQVLEKVKFIQFAESLGGVETLITFPAKQTHADIPVETREKLGIDDCLLRLSVGVEDVADIIADLDQALE
ncbi:MAG: PLP-dependent aspartate aminotransferase family protein [Sporomusaceae bacterium]|nr:PLP-dependent aspartate aminotransferase family protein [Sporomusaceae bacterium]